MAALVAPLTVEQSTCTDCVRPRVLAHELVTAETTRACIVVRRRVTVLEGCASCEGSSAVL